MQKQFDDNKKLLEEFNTNQIKQIKKLIPESLNQNLKEYDLQQKQLVEETKEKI